MTEQHFVYALAFLTFIFYVCYGQHNPTCEELITDQTDDICIEKSHISQPGFNLSYNCTNNVFTLRRRSRWFENETFEELGVIAEVVVDYTCTNENGETVIHAPFRTAVLERNLFQYRISMEGNYSSCTIGACMLLIKDTCWYRNRDFAICNSDEDNEEQVSSSLMSTSTASLLMPAASPSLQSIYSFVSLTQESTVSSSLYLPISSSTEEAVITNHETNPELANMQSVIVIVVAMAVSVAFLVIVFITIILVHRVSTSRTKTIKEEMNIDESIDTTNGYINGILDSMDLESLTRSVATVYEEIDVIPFKEMQQKKMETLLRTNTKGNEYVITTRLFRNIDYFKGQSSCSTLDDGLYLNKLSFMSLQGSCSNRGKPTNIDDYLEVIHGSGKTDNSNMTRIV